MKKYYLYTKEEQPELIYETYLVNREQIEIAYPNYDSSKHLMLEEKIINPIMDGVNIREMNNDELGIYGVRNLTEGEKIVNGTLVKEAQPSTLHTWNFDILTWEFNEAKESAELERIRSERNTKLRDCDWAVLPDVSLTEEEQTAVKEYRQALRDLPNNLDSVLNAVFPDKPNCL